jgi:L-ascorbate metabolism protein UlaG (beta-lactamase superfamily)
MADERLYLRQNIQVEPLFDQWYAWAHLISPATAARNVTERHLKIMDSYINAPQVHANAVKNPQMLGGPFIDYGGKRVDEIRALRDRTRKERAHLLELSQALAALDGLLRQQARGFSLAPLYAEVPEPLRGCVELVYDLSNHPNFRLIEPLLYRTKYYDESLQSLMLQAITGDDRPFVLSTPRLEDQNSIHVRVPFADARIDTLFRLKNAPQPWSEIRGLFDIPPSQDALFRSFFTTSPPPPYEPYTGPGLRWRYFGHACILLESRGTSILVDPVLSYTYESDISRYTYTDLPDTIDYVLITHNHQDHILIETLLQIRHKVKTVVVPRNASSLLQDPSLQFVFQKLGYPNVVALGELERLETEAGDIVGVPFMGEHSDLMVGTKLAYAVRLGAHRVLFAADSCNIEPALYRRVHEVVGDVDVVFIGMECDGAPLTWLYGPLLTQHLERAMDESRRLSGSNCRQAMAVVDQFHCKDAYVYAMGQEPWLNYVMSIKYTAQSRPIVESDALIAECTAKGIVAERLFGEKEILLTSADSITSAHSHGATYGRTRSAAFAG